MSEVSKQEYVPYLLISYPILWLSRGTLLPTVGLFLLLSTASTAALWTLAMRTIMTVLLYYLVYILQKVLDLFVPPPCP